MQVYGGIIENKQSQEIFSEILIRKILFGPPYWSRHFEFPKSELRFVMGGLENITMHF